MMLFSEMSEAFLEWPCVDDGFVECFDVESAERALRHSQQFLLGVVDAE